MTDEERQQLKMKMQKRFDSENRVSSDGRPVDNYNDADADADELHRKLEKSRRVGIILPIVLVLFTVVIGMGCFLMYRQLMNSQSSAIQTTEQSAESGAENNAMADKKVSDKSADKPMWSGEYDKAKIDEAVKNLYAVEDKDSGSTVYYSIADSVPTSDGKYNGKSVYENSGDLAISPLQFVLVRTGDTKIQMQAIFSWYSDKAIGADHINIISDDAVIGTIKLQKNDVNNDVNGKVLEKMTVDASELFADNMNTIVNANKGSYELVGEKLKTRNDFTESQIAGYKELADVMNSLVE